MVARNIPENVGAALLNIFNVHMYNHGNGVVRPNVGTTVLSTAESVDCRIYIEMTVAGQQLKS